MPLLWRSSRESRSERCKRAFLLGPICKVLLAPYLVSDRASNSDGPWLLPIEGANSKASTAGEFCVP